MDLKKMTNEQIRMICSVDEKILQEAFPAETQISVGTMNDPAYGKGSFSVYIGELKILSAAYCEEYPETTALTHHLENGLTDARKAKLEAILDIMLHTAKDVQYDQRLSKRTADALDATELPDPSRDLIWMGGSLEAAREGAFNSGPGPNKGAMIPSNGAVALIGKTPGGALRAVEIWHDGELQFEGTSQDDLMKPELEDYFPDDSMRPE
ncbi:MAG: hypothetical protein ABJN42_07400 [Roseibium sp.]|uniref:hypothetical protein n=1 Tax=Roseibium sp. TaxID=1936156 RepID=UPI0032979E7C